MATIPILNGMEAQHFPVSDVYRWTYFFSISFFISNQLPPWNLLLFVLKYACVGSPPTIVIPGFKWFWGFLGLIYLILKDLQTRVVHTRSASPIRGFSPNFSMTKHKKSSGKKLTAQDLQIQILKFLLSNPKNSSRRDKSPTSFA